MEVSALGWWGGGEGGLVGREGWWEAVTFMISLENGRSGWEGREGGLMESKTSFGGGIRGRGGWGENWNEIPSGGGWARAWLAGEGFAGRATATQVGVSSAGITLGEDKGGAGGWGGGRVPRGPRAGARRQALTRPTAPTASIHPARGWNPGNSTTQSPHPLTPPGLL